MEHKNQLNIMTNHESKKDFANWTKKKIQKPPLFIMTPPITK